MKTMKSRPEAFIFACNGHRSCGYSRRYALDNKLFLAQFDTIKDIASKGPCVIIGRCADYALEDYKNVLNVFIYADMEDKKKRAVEEYGLKAKNIEDAIIKTDKKKSQLL